MLFFRILQNHALDKFQTFSKNTKFQSRDAISFTRILQKINSTFDEWKKDTDEPIFIGHNIIDFDESVLEYNLFNNFDLYLKYGKHKMEVGESLEVKGEYYSFGLYYNIKKKCQNWPKTYLGQGGCHKKRQKWKVQILFNIGVLGPFYKLVKKLAQFGCDPLGVSG